MLLFTFSLLSKTVVYNFLFRWICDDGGITLQGLSPLHHVCLWSHSNKSCRVRDVLTTIPGVCGCCSCREKLYLCTVYAPELCVVLWVDEPVHTSWSVWFQRGLTELRWSPFKLIYWKGVCAVPHMWSSLSPACDCTHSICFINVCFFHLLCLVMDVLLT